jgi:hypothetical protein
MKTRIINPNHVFLIERPGKMYPNWPEGNYLKGCDAWTYDPKEALKYTDIISATTAALFFGLDPTRLNFPRFNTSTKVEICPHGIPWLKCPNCKP